MPITNLIIDAALELAGNGWRVIPCDLEKKHPPIKGWQKLATTDEDQIVEWWSNGFSKCGVSIAFGPSSGIIDIDCDNAADGDKLRDIAFGGEWPVTPTYLSGKRKTPHRLFRWRDDLPDLANRNLRDVADLDIDLKLGAGDKGSHSLVPPSKGYEWLQGLSPNECEVAELPDSFVAWLQTVLDNGNGGATAHRCKSDAEWEEIAQGVTEGSRNDAMASVVGKLARGLDDLSKANVEILTASALGLNQTNKPPLSDDEVRKVVLSIVRTERARRAAEEMDKFVVENIDPSEPEKPADDAPSGTEKTNGDKAKRHNLGLRLVRINGDPVTYELHSPKFQTRSCKGFLRLSAAQLNSARAIMIAATEQAGVCLSPSFRKQWEKEDGLLSRLMESATERDADPTENRSGIVAQAILSRIGQSQKRSRGGELTDRAGTPTWQDDGSVIVGSEFLTQSLDGDPCKPTRRELNRVLALIGCEKRERVRVSGPTAKQPQIRIYRLTKEALKKLDDIAWGAE